MTATDRAAALELARYYSDPERSDAWNDHHREAIAIARALLAAEAERERLVNLINTPRTDDFFEAVRNEATHQILRWGVEHDAGKRPEDWIALFIYLLGKATKAHYSGDRAKLEHHVITCAAVALNWHRNMTGVSTSMRPGVGPQEPPMKRVVIESPYAGNVELNLRYLRACMRDCVTRGESPYASHGLLTQDGVLDDNNPDERALGIAAGFAWRDVADKTVVYTDLGMSGGMRHGINDATSKGRPIEYRTLKGWSDLPPSAMAKVGDA